MRTRADGIAVHGETVLWKVGCGDEFSPALSKVESCPVNGGPVVTHYMPDRCQSDRVASTSIAVDASRIYWLTGGGQVVSLPRSSPGATPTVLCQMTARPGGWPSPFGIAIHSATVYWSEGSSIFAVPSSGGTPSTVLTLAGRGPIVALRATVDGQLIFLHDRRLFRLRIGGPPTPDVIAEGVPCFGVGGSRLTWATTSPGRPLTVASARLDLGDRRTHHTTNAGVDTVAVDEANIYVHEVRNVTGGPILRVPLNGEGPTPISEYLLGNKTLEIGGRYLFFTDFNTGVYRVATGAPMVRPPGDVWITGLEVVQSVQTRDHRVPLVARKRTFVRAYVQSREDDRGAWERVSARLVAEGSSRWHSPVNSYTITVSPGGSDRRTLGDSFLFELDREETAPGTRGLEVRLFPPAGRPEANMENNSATVSVTFGPELRASVYGARYRYRNVNEPTQRQNGLSSSTWAERSLSDLEQHRVVTENMHALTSFVVRALPGDPIGEFDCRAVQDPEGRWGCAGFEDCRPWGQGLIDRLHPEGGAWIYILQPEVTTAYLGGHWSTGPGNHVVNMQHNPSDPGMTMAHEMGHGWTLGHPQDYGDGSGRDVNYPRADGSMGPEVGIRYFPRLQAVPGQTATGGVERDDIMSYDAPFWISPYSYCKAMRAISGGRLPGGPCE